MFRVDGLLLRGGGQWLFWFLQHPQIIFHGYLFFVRYDSRNAEIVFLWVVISGQQRHATTVERIFLHGWTAIDRGLLWCKHLSKHFDWKTRCHAVVSREVLLAWLVETLLLLEFLLMSSVKTVLEYFWVSIARLLSRFMCERVWLVLHHSLEASRGSRDTGKI